MKPIRVVLIAAVMLPLVSCATLHEGEGIVRTLPADTAVNSDAAWAAQDFDQDGYLSRAELEQQLAMGVLQDFPNADADADGRVSRQEWDAWWPRMTDHHIWAEPMTMYGATDESSSAARMHNR